MENGKLNLLSLGILLSLVLLPSVFAIGIIQTDHFYDMSNHPLTNVRNVFYNCAGAYINPQGEMRCTSVGSLRFDLNSGSSNSISFEYPYNPFSTESNPDYYSQYVFKDCYMPHDYIKYVWGSGVSLDYDYNFYKVQSCHSPIDSFSITNTNYANEPVIVNMAVVAEADAESAFTDYNNGEVWYPPFGDYTTETKVTFSVVDSSGNVAYTQSKTVEISWDSFKNVQFSWTPSIQGNYTAKIETEVTDCQCESNFKQYSEKKFLVWAARPKNECYTIINDLETIPNTIKEKTPIVIKFNKISNYADNSYAKTAIPTAVTYEITQGSVSVYSSNSLIPANTNTNNYQVVDLGWTPLSGGDYAIRVQGFGQSPLCVGKTNPIDTETLGIFVDSEITYNVHFAVKDSAGTPINQATVNFGSSTGKTDSFGNLNFKVNPGTYDWQVSKTGYVTQTGSLLVNKNTTFSVALTPVILPPEAIYNVQFIVKDNAGAPIDQATVNFGSLTGNTNSSGMLNFNINAGTYNWQISKTNYITQNGNILVDRNRTLHATLSSVPSTTSSAPVLNIPDQHLLENSENNDNLIHLHHYTTDIDTPMDNINYALVSQSNISLVNCSIDSNKYLDCNIKNNTFGFSEITISASDGTNNSVDSFRVYVDEIASVTKAKFIYPVGGEKLSGNVKILWNATSSKNHALLINLYYSTDNGTVWNVLKENETNDGTYTWSTTSYPNKNYLLRIKAFDLVSGISMLNQTQKEFSVNNPSHTHSDSEHSDKVVKVCESLWKCSGWSACIEGTQTKTCEDINSCGDSLEKSIERRNCGDSQNENIALSIKTSEKNSLGEKVFSWIIFGGLLLISLLIIFAFVLILKKR